MSLKMSLKNAKKTLTVTALSAAMCGTAFAGVPSASAGEGAALGWTKYRVSTQGAKGDGQVRRVLGKIVVVGRTVDRTCLDGPSYTKITPRPPYRGQPIKVGYACGSEKRFRVVTSARSIAIQVCSVRQPRCSQRWFFTIR